MNVGGCSPYSWAKPIVQRNTPPKATSSPTFRCQYQAVARRPKINLLPKTTALSSFARAILLGCSEGAFWAEFDDIPKTVADLAVLQAQLHVERYISERTHSLIHILLSGLAPSIWASTFRLICPTYSRRFQSRFTRLSQYL